MYRPQPWTGSDCVSIGMMMVDMLDAHWDVKLARERIAARLNNPKLESDLYPVGSWRDRPPTGEVVDLTQPRPAPPASSDDEDEDRTQAHLGSGVTPASDKNAVILSESLWRRAKDLRVGPSESADESSSDMHNLRAALRLPDCDGCAPGSNNWVISGKHTASGKPLLSNDMHLQTHRTEHLVHGGPAGFGISRGRRNTARLALCDCRAQRPRRLGIHRALRRRAGPLCRKSRRQRQLRRARQHHGSRSQSIAKLFMCALANRM